MIKKTTPLVTVVVAVGVAVGVTQASTPKSHHVDKKGEGTGISHPPFTKTTNFAGTLGTNGAIIEKRVFKSGSSTSFGGTATVFGPQGSYSGTITKGTVTEPSGCPSPCNQPPKKETAKVKISAGGGRYKGVTGIVTITDTYISGSPGFFKIVVAGTIDY
jgi:hypothetical protein